MKIVNVNGRYFENGIDLVRLVEEQGYKEFNVGESVLLYGEEIPVEDASIDLDTGYLCHSGILGEDDTVFYTLVTTDYNDDLNIRYRPLLLIRDNEDGEYETLVKFE